MLRIAAAGIVLGLIAVAAGFAFLLFGSSRLTGTIQTAAANALGRDVSIGSFRVSEIGPPIRLRFTDVQIANPEWATNPFLVDLAEAEVAIEVWPLLRGQIDIADLILSDPRLSLERGSDGQANWRVGPVATAAGEVLAPEDRTEFPAIANLTVTGGGVAYHDPTANLSIETTIEAASGAIRKDTSETEFAFQGTLNGDPLSIAFTGGTVDALRAEDQPFPFEIDLSLGAATANIDGTIPGSASLQEFEVAASLSGQDLSEFISGVTLPLPSTPPYDLSGNVRRAGDIWRITDLNAIIGGSTIRGTAGIDLDASPLKIDGDLTAPKIVLDDFAGFIGAPPGPDTSTADGAFPDKELDLAALRLVDLDVQFSTDQVVTKWSPIDAIAGRIRLDSGVMTVDPLDLTVAGGAVAGTLSLDASGPEPAAATDLDFSDLDLKPFFAGTQFVQETGGLFSGHITLEGAGTSVDEIMSNAAGSGWLGIRDGRISALLVEAAGLDVFEALILVVDSDAAIPIRCGRIDATVAAGNLTIEQGLLDTSDSVIVASGMVNLAAEKLNLGLEAHAKDFSLIDLAAPVGITGKLSDPSFSIGSIDGLPFFELGDTQSLPCDRLLSGQSVGQLIEK